MSGTRRKKNVKNNDQGLKTLMHSRISHIHTSEVT